MGALLIEKLNALKAKHPFIKEVRGKGLPHRELNLKSRRN